jgi:hypothetical protein
MQKSLRICVHRCDVAVLLFFLPFSRILIFHFHICFSVILSFFCHRCCLAPRQRADFLFFFEKPGVLIESPFGGVVN